MGVTCCEGIIIGADLGIYRSNVSKDVRIIKLGHFDPDNKSYVFDGQIIEAVKLSHSITYHTGASDMGLKPEKKLPSSIMYLSEVSINLDRHDFGKQTYVWIEEFVNPSCDLEDFEWQPTFSIAECCFSVMDSVVNATYRESVEYKTINGPVSGDGVSQDSPVSGLVYITPLSKRQNLQYIVDMLPQDELNSLPIVSACGSFSMSLQDGILISRSEEESYASFKTWTFVFEKNVSLTQ
jgi:hypothetical protein